MLAPERFAEWMSKHEHKDRRYGYVYNYHPRSDAHSVALCEFILDDLLEACTALRSQAERGEIAYGVNLKHTWSSTGKTKTLDLAIGLPSTPPHMALMKGRMSKVQHLSEVFFSCEAKSVMTEHVKSKPRIYDELSSSHEIVHQGNQNAIATGITVVNIAEKFVSPTRQNGSGALHVSVHKQPQSAKGVIEHLHKLPIRDANGQVGFDAYATFVVDCDNQSPAHLFTNPPAPQSGDKEHYDTFIQRISQFYAERYAIIPGLS